MRYFYVLSFLIFSHIISAQVENSCLAVDFETIPGAVPFEGLEISDQFFDAFGMTIILENGNPAVLAQVGLPTTAFGSDFGSDTPAPGQNIGSFFITDDGLLQGLSSIPVIVEFENPIDSFSGCILDMDFGEIFFLEARDEFDNIILADTIRGPNQNTGEPGDPGTGDGLATCWGFNLPGCEGSVYSIRFVGERTFGGSFGLGMDNFSFCTTGIDIITNVRVETQNITCGNLGTGSILINYNGNDNLTYSLDGVNYQDSPLFTNLDAGTYSVFIQNEQGCVGELNPIIEIEEPVEILTAVPVATVCDEDNGNVTILTNEAGEVQYSIDGINFQSENTFVNLAPGDYIAITLDENNCQSEFPFTIDPSTLLFVNNTIDENENCNLSNGMITIETEDGMGPFQYSINNGPTQSSPVFENLAAGSYTIEVIDANGCSTTDEVSLENIGELFLVDINIMEPDCEDRTATLEIEHAGGTGSIFYTLNDELAQSSNTLLSVDPGVYEVLIYDDFGCEARQSIDIGIPYCDIYIPNVFTPNRDGNNDSFSIYTTSLYDVSIVRYSVFDRWGELVYDATNFDIRQEDNYWDGTFRDQPAESGVYAYLIEVIHENGYEEFFSGSITLLR
jgi:gliding motility-associated-like protein